MSETHNHDNAIYITLGAYVIGGMIYAATRIHVPTFGVPTLPPLAWAFLAGFALRSRLAFLAGELWRVYTHARGIRVGGTAHVLGRRK